MAVSLDYIKKLMGWCPNAKMTETGTRISPAYFEVHDRSGGEKSDRSGREKAKSNLNQLKRIGFLLSSIGAFVSALTLVMEKDNTSSLMVGVGTLLFLIGTIIYIRS